MAEIHLRDYSTSLAIKEMRIKAALTILYQSEWMAKIKMVKTAYAGEDEE